MRQMIYRLMADPEVKRPRPRHFISTDQSFESSPSSEASSTELFWITKARHKADWQGSLHFLFPNAPVFQVELPAAVIITKVPAAEGDMWFAICYGHGHTLLDNSKIMRRWGLIVALNLICANVKIEESLRRVDSRVIRANSLAVARQVARPDTIDSFDLNTQSDILRAITGSPASEEWGSIVYGQDGVSISVPPKERLAGLHNLLGELQVVHDKPDYRGRFGWIDHIYPVRDVQLRSALLSALIQKLRVKDIENLSLNSPEITDWGNSVFRIKGVGVGNASPDPTLRDYVDALENRKPPTNAKKAANALVALTPAKLKQHRLVNETTGDSWPLFECIEGEIVLDGTKYYFVDGQFIEVDPDFVAEVDQYLARKIPPSKRSFPDNNGNLAESKYIARIANRRKDLLVMDQQFIQGFPVPSSRVELCDLLSDKREFIHLKRGIRSSTFSHLVMQAEHSVEYFWRSEEFRQSAIQKITEVEGAAAPPLPQRWSGSLSGKSPHELGARVILAATGNWGKQCFIERIPFFSRLTLRLAIQSLEGFNVQFESMMIEEH